jgi:hypothetical protein
MNPDVKALRAMVVLALASCGGGGGEPAAPKRPKRRPRPVATVDATPAPPPPRAAPKPEVCDAQPDTIFESACTSLKGACRPEVKSDWLDADEAASKLHVTSRRDRVELLFDQDLTDRYRMAHDGNGCCYARCTELVVGAAKAKPVPFGYLVKTVFIPRPKGGTSAPSGHEPSCPAAVQFGGEAHPFERKRDDLCGYRFLERDPAHIPPKGRAARVGGVARYVDIERGVDDATVAWWIDAARAEHASIAAFGNLSLQLMAVGAPAALIEATHLAALDEIRHARDAFAIASRLAGRPIEPGPFPAAAELRADLSIARLAAETLVDGASPRAAPRSKPAAPPSAPSPRSPASCARSPTTKRATRRSPGRSSRGASPPTPRSPPPSATTSPPPASRRRPIAPVIRATASSATPSSSRSAAKSSPSPRRCSRASRVWSRDECFDRGDRRGLHGGVQSQ